MTPNQIVKGKDLPDFRNFLQIGDPASFSSPLTITGTAPALVFDDTNNENFRIDADADVLSIKNDTGPITFIRFRGGANDDIQVDRPITFNSTVSGLTFSDLTLSDTSPSITFTDTNGEDYVLTADADNFTFVNTTGSITFITLRGGANDDVQVNRIARFEEDVHITNDHLQINTTQAQDAVTKLAINNDANNSSAVVAIIQQLGTADIGMRIAMDAATSASIPALQVTHFNGSVVDSHVNIRASGEIRVSPGYPANLSDNPAANVGTAVTLGGQYQQRTTTAGNVGAGIDPLHSYTIAAYVLANDGDSLDFIGGGSILAAGNNKQLYFYINGSPVFATGAFDPASDIEWTLRVTVIRIDSDSVIASGLYSDTNGNTVAIGNSTQLNGLDFTADITMEWRGEDSDGTSNRVVQNMSVVRKFARAQ